jgi:hypothetical protein
MLTAAADPLQIIANANERRDPDGNALGIRIALIKATDRRRYKTEFLSAKDLAVTAEKATQEVLRLENETSRFREQFIAVLGHDLRNPLASISAGARILDRTVQSEQEHRVFDRVVVAEGDALHIHDAVGVAPLQDSSGVRMLQKESQHFLRGIRPLCVRIGSGGAPSGPSVAGAVDVPVLQNLPLAVDVGRSGISMPSRNLPAMHFLLRLGRSDSLFDDLGAIAWMHGGVAIAVKNNGRDHRAGRRRTSAFAPLPHGGERRGHIGSGSAREAGMDPDRSI